MQPNNLPKLDGYDFIQIQAQVKDDMPSDIKLDIDNWIEDYLSLFEDIASKLTSIQRILGYEFYSCKIETNKKNSHNLHIYIRFAEPIPDIAVPFIQLYLGSHDKRELYNLQRIIGNINQNILFTIKMEVVNGDVKVISEYEYNEVLTNQFLKVIKDNQKYIYT